MSRHVQQSVELHACRSRVSLPSLRRRRKRLANDIPGRGPHSHCRAFSGGVRQSPNTPYSARHQPRKHAGFSPFAQRSGLSSC